MKKKILQFIGDAIIILACSIPAGFLIEQYNEGYNYYFNLFIHESEPQLLTTSTWYILRCWQIRGCTSAVIVLLMSVYSMIIKANSRKYNITFIIISIVYAGFILGLNQLLGICEISRFSLDIINYLLNDVLVLVFGITYYFDFKKNMVKTSK